MPYRRIYEINTRVWLAELVAAQTIPEATLAAIPESYINLWRRWHIDAIWLMGVWEPSLYSARVVRENTASVVSLQPALDDFTLDDCVSSPYAVRNYTVSEQLGGLEGLLRLRARLHQAGLGLILDFVPNHTACDHPWVHDYPQYYVQGSLSEAARAPGTIFLCKLRRACAISPWQRPLFPSWCDTAQLNYSNLELHDAMQDQLLRLAQWCDGVRCDMAMLCLSDVFSRTWSRLDLPVPPREFWHEALQAVRHASRFLLYGRGLPSASACSSLASSSRMTKSFMMRCWRAISTGWELAYAPRTPCSRPTYVFWKITTRRALRHASVTTSRKRPCSRSQRSQVRSCCMRVRPRATESGPRYNSAAVGKSPAISVCGVFTSASYPCQISDRAILLGCTRARHVREMTRTKRSWPGLGA